MKLYSHLQPKDAKFIVARANNVFSMYKIAKITGLNKDKMRRCLNKCKIETRKPNHSQPWKGPHIKIRYSFKQRLLDQDLSKLKRAYEYAQHAQTVYKTFVNFFGDVFENKKILGKKIKHIADEFIKEFKKINPLEPCPIRQWVYRMAKSDNYIFNHKWLPHSKRRKFCFKSDHEQLKATKYNSIHNRPDKVKLIAFAGNFEINSFICKRNIKKLY